MRWFCYPQISSLLTKRYIIFYISFGAEHFTNTAIKCVNDYANLRKWCDLNTHWKFLTSFLSKVCFEYPVAKHQNCPYHILCIYWMYKRIWSRSNHDLKFIFEGFITFDNITQILYFIFFMLTLAWSGWRWKPFFKT